MRDMEPFRNSSTALATATTRKSNLQKTRENKTVITKQKLNIRYAKTKIATTEQSTGSNWRCHVANHFAIASHEFNHLRVTWQTSLNVANKPLGNLAYNWETWNWSRRILRVFAGSNVTVHHNVMIIKNFIIHLDGRASGKDPVRLVSYKTHFGNPCEWPWKIRFNL